MSGSDNHEPHVVLASREYAGLRVTLLAATLATEATRYLEAIDLFRSLELKVRWRSEADEVGVFSPPELQRPPGCVRCAGPLVRINGQHVCFGRESTTEGAPRCQR